MAPPRGARLRYRRDGDIVVLRLEGHVHDELRFWKTLQTFGVPLKVLESSKELIRPRYVPAGAFAKVEQAAKLLRAELAPEEGEVPILARTPRADAWRAARPLDAAAVIEAARAEEPRTGERMLHEARVRLKGFAHEDPSWAEEARRDAAAVDQALGHLQERIRSEAEATRREERRAVSEEIQGVAAEDVWRAHEALKKLRAAVEAQEKKAAERRARGAPEVGETLPGFLGRLRPYQREGVAFLLGRDLNAILADDMGLGKTIMAMAAVVGADTLPDAAGRSRPAGEAPTRALVVGPANVLYNWAEEVERFTGERALVWHRQRLEGPRGARFLVTTYDSLRTIPWDGPAGEEIVSRPVLVLDEAHLVRNPDTQRAALVRALPQTRRILLTGTPLVNSVEDYYELLSQVEPGRWGSRENFRDSWLVDATLFNRYAQVRNATALLLQRAARDIMLRRRKEDVLKELPPRTIRVVRHELDAAAEREQRRLEGALAETLRKGKTEVAVFAALTALRQSLALARVDAVLDRVRDLRAAGETVVVYSQFLEPLRRLLAALGEEAAMLEGATLPRERQRLARTLGTEAGPKVLLAQMDAGGLGLNFTGARYVLFVHLGWTPSGHAQAIDRVHRIGQDRPVVVELFITPSTVDERLARILLRKEADQNLVLADDADVLNRNELARVLAEDAAERAAAEAAPEGL